MYHYYKTIKNVKLDSFKEITPNNNGLFLEYRDKFFNHIFDDVVEKTVIHESCSGVETAGVIFEKGGDFIAFAVVRGTRSYYFYDVKHKKCFVSSNKECGEKIDELVVKHFLNENNLTLDTLSDVVIDSNITLKKIEYSYCSYYHGHFFLYSPYGGDKKMRPAVNSIIERLEKIKDFEKYILKRDERRVDIVFSVGGFNCEMTCYANDFPTCNCYDVFFYVKELRLRFCQIYRLDEEYQSFFDRLFDFSFAEDGDSLEKDIMDFE